MGKTSIEWVEFSWNPIRARNKATGKTGHYCQRISPGCLHCYAASMNIWRGNGVDYTMPALAEVELYLDEEALLEPLHWRKPRSVFVCSMTDLYANFVLDEWIEQIYAVMALTEQHTYMVLTKRPARRQRWYERIEEDGGEGFRDAMVEGRAQAIYSKLHPEDGHVEEWLAVNLPLKNVREGVSICTQKEWDEQVPHLLNTPAALRWISMEPMLERIEMDPVRVRDGVKQDPLYGSDGIRWVVVGGESGRVARPCNAEWIHYIILQCRDMGVPCFVKQLGAHVIQNGERHRKRDIKGGDMSEWPHEIRVREMPQ